jgi:fructose-1,6-bisphosphatase
MPNKKKLNKLLKKYKKQNISDELNKQIDRLCNKAFVSAKRRAIRNRYSIVVSMEDKLYKVYPNGEKEFIKTITSSVSIVKKSFKISL